MAQLGQFNLSLLLIDREVAVINFRSCLQLGYQGIDPAVHVRGVLGCTGDDQGSPGLVNQDRIDFVHDGEGQARLSLVCHGKRHIVPQVIKTKFVVGSINNIASVGVPLLGGPLPRANDPDRHAKKVIDGPHPGGIAPRQIVVHGHQVHRITSQRIEVGGQGRNQCLALTGTHFRNLAFMEDDAADQLHIEMPHTQCPLARFANRRKRLG